MYFNKYTRYTNQTIVSDFTGGLSDWVLSGNGNAYEDTDIVNISTKSIRMESINETIPVLSLSGTWNFTITHNIDLSFYVNDRSIFNLVHIRFFTGANYYYKSLNVAYTGWNRAHFPKLACSVSGTPDWSNIDTIQLLIQGTAGSTFTVNFEYISLWSSPLSKAIVYLTWDDGYAQVINTIKPIMDNYNLVGEVNVVGSFINSSQSFMTVSDLHELLDAGWVCNSHTWEHISLPTLSDVAVLNQLVTNIKWMENNNIPGSEFLVYPGGATNSNVQNIVSNYHISARSINTPYYNWYPLETLPFGDPLKLRALNLGSDTPIATAKSYIDNVIESKGILIFYGHLLGDVASSTVYTTADFTELCTYIKSKVDSGNIINEVMH